jgi:predicted 3-demethylubiquinone-9 3-methyltransferase (glyoxalase superfamily)
MISPTQKIAIATCLWFNKNAEEAAKFYAQTFPNSRVTAVHKSPADYHNGKAGDVLTVEFTVLGQPFVGLNGGPGVPFTDAVSFQVFTDTQEETDRYWDAIVKNGGQAIACSWCKDKFGLSWQIVPRVLIEAMHDPDTAAAKRVMQAMMQMVKIDIAKIQAARRG